ncbi:MAG: uracil-DNA glycosylase [Candidatus Westeberhardia cardiocondylae]|nr:uracil-DNA glycosylase [Candidatus Westeberhardia cardiocondylae]
MKDILTWGDFLSCERNFLYFQKILLFLRGRYFVGATIYPRKQDIFRVFFLTELSSVKVVIVAQDPYHGPNQANGLAFSVHVGVSVPPSLLNIYRELHSDIFGFYIPKHGCLQSWAKQGVFLLNSVLTVEEGVACSHANIGWEIFTDRVIQILNIYREGIVFLLWGNYAKKKGRIIDCSRHYVLYGSHPSPFSANRGFFGCCHFSKTNCLLKKQGLHEINWQPIL